MTYSKELIDRLYNGLPLSREDYIFLIANRSPEISSYLFESARKKREEFYGKKVFIRGLIEFTSYCKNDCLYCGLRRSNKNAGRYRLNEEDILLCCTHGYELGFRTFVLQGGEDPYYTDKKMISIISSVKKRFPDCALTLSAGEKSRTSYQDFFDAGADRYLLRHETADPAHYGRLHPREMSFENRMRCLHDLKDIGYQVGCGFMVGSPFQTIGNVADEMLFMREFRPHMVGIGPFIPHHDTPFADKTGGSADLTIFLLGLIRLTLPYVLLPSTTALGTIHPKGRELGILAGANVVMPNLSPEEARKQYMIYDNKLNTGAESADGLNALCQKIETIGYSVVTDRGDCNTSQ